MIDFSHLLPNQTIAVAVSGGKDSMCLLHALAKQSKKLKITVKAINIDHSIRGEESARDSLFVKNYCALLGVPLKFFKVDAVKFSNQNGCSLEEGARILRYDVFENLLKEGFADKIATAHHLLDNFETVLFNIFRGTGPKGIVGITDRDNFIRPLINATREEIDEYVNSHQIPFVVDSTNFDVDYTRNYIRNVLSPEIIKKFPSAPLSVKRLSDTIKEEDEFLTSLAKKAVVLESDRVSVKTSVDKVILKRAIIIALNECGLKKDYEKTHIESVFNLLNLNSGASVDLPLSIRAVNNYDKLTFYVGKQSKELKEFAYSLNKFDFDFGTAVISKTNDYIIDNLKTCKPLKTLVFDGDKIPKTAVIRTRRDGDVFKKFGGGTKKLNDYFTDVKIPKFERDNVLLVADKNEVLIVFGKEISDKIKTDNQTKTALYALFYKN